MPKMKTNRGTAKRFKATAKGLKRRRANRNHILTKKATKRKLHLRSMTMVAKSDVESIKRLLRKK